MNNKSVSQNLNSIIMGILLVLISIVVLVTYIIRYKHVDFGDNNNNNEGFLNTPELKELKFEDDLFDNLIDTSQYNMRINEIRNDRIEYENKRRQNLRDQTERDKIKAVELAKNREQLLMDQYKANFEEEPKIIKSIKANSNNQILSTLPVNVDEYQININGDCLTVYDDNKYFLDKCNSSIGMSDSQLFGSKRIHDMYEAKLDTGKDVTTRSTYPYNTFRSKVTNNCLSLDNNGVSVAKCNPNDKRQQFKISGQSSLCDLA
jgi:hypothetical protein